MSRSRKNAATRKPVAAGFGTMTPAQQRWQTEMERRHDRGRRSVCTGFKYWRRCDEKACRRRKACMGDAEACFKLNWPRTSEADKIFFRTGIKARIAGLSVEEACRVANAEVARSADYIAEVDAVNIARLKAELEAERAARGK